MKKEYVSPVVSIVRLDNSIMQIAMSDTPADKNAECYSKKNSVSFSDDDDDDMAIGW